MSLDELHARRLATLITLVENALSRIELTLKEIERNRDGSGVNAVQIQSVREKSKAIRGNLQKAAQRFSVSPERPEPRQRLVAELSALSIVLENARPRRMKGYGREFQAEDKADWESMIQNLTREVDALRDTLTPDS